MNDKDDVFFFTLIDFLIQICFFGIFVACATHLISERSKENEAKVDKEVGKLRKAAGVSSITEITDILSRLGPLDELKGFSEFLKRFDEPHKLKNTQRALERAGGPAALLGRLDKLTRLEEGSGKPPCLARTEGEKRIPIPLATVIASDTTIEFENENTNLEAVLTLLGRDFTSTRRLSLEEFKRAFTPLRQKKPDCMYTLNFIEHTRFVDARDAVGTAFYLKIDRRGHATANR